MFFKFTTENKADNFDFSFEINSSCEKISVIHFLCLFIKLIMLHRMHLMKHFFFLFWERSFLFKILEFIWISWEIDRFFFFFSFLRTSYSGNYSKSTTWNDTKVYVCGRMYVNKWMKNDAIIASSNSSNRLIRKEKNVFSQRPMKS